jgi:hypothetical protein
MCLNCTISCALHRLCTSDKLFQKKGDNEMKVVVRLAILVAAFLLVSNMAFAECEQKLCYEIVTTSDSNTFEWNMYVCLSDDGTGYACGGGECGDLYPFGGGPGWFNTSGDPAIGGNPRWTTWIFSSDGGDNIGFMNPIGDGYMLTGEGKVHGTKYIIRGKKVPLSNCPVPL